MMMSSTSTFSSLLFKEFAGRWDQGISIAFQSSPHLVFPLFLQMDNKASSGHDFLRSQSNTEQQEGRDGDGWGWARENFTNCVLLQCERTHTHTHTRIQKERNGLEYISIMAKQCLSFVFDDDQVTSCLPLFGGRKPNQLQNEPKQERGKKRKSMYEIVREEGGRMGEDKHNLSQILSRFSVQDCEGVLDKRVGNVCHSTPFPHKKKKNHKDWRCANHWRGSTKTETWWWRVVH